MTSAGNDGTVFASSDRSMLDQENCGGPEPSNNPKDVDLTNIARRLIVRLRGNFHAEGKTTCRDCLRTKTLPCSRVVEVADGDIFSGNDGNEASYSSPQILQKANEILVDEYTKFLPPNPPMTSSTMASTTAVSYDGATTDPSSLQCMNRISVILRFIQLLLLLSKRQQESQRQPSSFFSAEEVNKMMVTLLEGWTNGVNRFCATVHNAPGVEKDAEAMDEDGDNDSNNGDWLTANATRGLESGPVFCYAFYSLLRMNEYVQTRGALLVPLWKGLCELAKLFVAPPSNVISASDRSTSGDAREETLEKEDDDGEIEDWRERLSPNMLGDAIRVLGDFLEEGKGRLELEAFQSFFNVGEKEEAHSAPTGDARIIFQGKFVGFMVTRLAQLLRIYFSVCETVSQSMSSEQRLDPFLNGVWRSLLGLRGMAAALQLLHSTGEFGTKKDQEIDISFLKVYCEMAAKAGKCITDTILKRCQQPRQICIPALDSLLLSNMVTGDDDHYRHQDRQEEIRSNLNRMSAMTRTIGKVSALQQILEIVTSDTMCCRCPGNVEALLATIQHLHSTSVPQCFSACIIAVRSSAESQSSGAVITTPTTIVLGSLKIMARAVQEIELSSEFMASPKRDSFYRLLVKWLAGSACGSDCHDEQSSKENHGVEFCQKQHPVSRELVLSLLHAHIVGCERGSDNKGGAKKLLSYIAKLLMDARTSSGLRRNIGALLIRLQSSLATCDRSVACTVASELIEKEFVSWLKTSRQTLSKKRKRTRSGQLVATGLNQDDVMVITRVMSTGRGVSESLLSSSASGIDQRVLRREFTRLSSDCTNESTKREKILLVSADRNSLLLAWLERCIAMGPTTSFQTFRRITGLDLLVDVVRPVLSAVSDLKFKFGSNNGDNIDWLKKKVMLYSAAMRLSVTWATVFGDEGKLPLERVCLLIKHSVSKDPWQQPNVEDSNLSVVRDQHCILKFEALKLLKSIGKAIPNNCTERNLKVRNSLN